MSGFLALRSSSFLSPSVAGALFESHWVYWIAILAAGVVLLFLSQSRGDGRLFKAGGIAVGVTVVWMGAAFLFTTPGERLYAMHGTMADAAAHGDADGVLACMDRSFTIDNLSIGRETAADAAREEIASRLKQLGIRQTHFTDYHASIRADGTATTQFVALTESENGLIKSQWAILWSDEVEADWRVKDARLLKLVDQAVSPGEVVK